MSSLSVKKLVVLLGIVFIARPALPADSATFERSANGVTFHTSNGNMSIAVCSDRVIHVVVSPTKEIPESNVPSVTRPCSGTPFKLSSTPANVSVKTTSMNVEIDRSSLAVKFKNSAGDTVLAEQDNSGRSIAPIKIGEVPSYEVRQDFILSPDEALYGLGQHQ